MCLKPASIASPIVFWMVCRAVARDDVDGCGDLGQHRWRSEAVARHEQAQAQSLGPCGEKSGRQSLGIHDRGG
jgi:hypothetical protein